MRRRTDELPRTSALERIAADAEDLCGRLAALSEPSMDARPSANSLPAISTAEATAFATRAREAHASLEQPANLARHLIICAVRASLVRPHDYRGGMVALNGYREALRLAYSQLTVVGVRARQLAEARDAGGEGGWWRRLRRALGDS